MGDSPTSPVQRKRRWLRFSVRGLLLLILILSVGLGTFGRDLYHYRERESAAKQIAADGGYVGSANSGPRNPFSIYSQRYIPLPEAPPLTTYQRWMAWLATEDIYDQPHSVIITQADAEPLLLGLDHFPKLLQLTIGPGTLSDASVQAICRRKALQRITLIDTRMTPGQVGQLAALPDLTEIEFRDAAITPEVLAELAQIQQLKTVRLISKQISAESLTALRSVPIDHLVVEVADDPHAVPHPEEPLKQLTQLTTLQLYNYPIGEDTFAAIGQMDSLWMGRSSPRNRCGVWPRPRTWRG